MCVWSPHKKCAPHATRAHARVPTELRAIGAHWRLSSHATTRHEVRTRRVLQDPPSCALLAHTCACFWVPLRVTACHGAPTILHRLQDFGGILSRHIFPPRLLVSNKIYECSPTRFVNSRHISPNNHSSVKLHSRLH